MGSKLETETGWLLQSKVKQINEKWNTSFKLAITDATGKPEDWLYCLKVGKYFLEEEWDGQEMFAYLCGMYHGARIGKYNG